MSEQGEFPALPMLLVDDEPGWLTSLELLLLRKLGINHLYACSDSQQAMEHLGRGAYSLVLLDVTMPGIPGDKLLEKIVETYPDLPVIMLTGRDQVETAVECMSRGAFDFVVKSWDEERLLASVKRALRLQSLQLENMRLGATLLQKQVQSPDAFAGVVTQSLKMEAIMRYLEAIAGSGEPLLLSGESGTGKEVLAMALHRLGEEASPWVAVNMAGFDDERFADTLFGHVRGAYAGASQSRRGMVERAAGGTLFLDEIGSLGVESQGKLLRFLQTGEYFPLGSDAPRHVRTRVVVTTNQSLEDLVAQGKFRRDLYFRLRTHHVQVPSLRERPEDIPLLLGYFLAEAAQELGKGTPTPPPELELLLSRYDFPGNVRELRSMAYDAVSLHQGRKLSMASFKRAMGWQEKSMPPAAPVPKSVAAGDAAVAFGERLPTIKEVVNALIDEAMQRYEGNQSLVAKQLGITQPALSMRLKKRRE